MARFWKPIKNRVQSELIRRGYCVGCGRSLSDAERRPYPGHDDWELVFCSCRRIFVYDKVVNSYRRAKIEEVKLEVE